jgi:L-amino acid N-acyltransferase YncA
MTYSTMNSIRDAVASDATQILAIYAPFVTDTAVSFEFEPPDEDEICRRIAEVQTKYPWLVWDNDGRVLGYAYASSHRARLAYQWSVEVSVYVHGDALRSGIAKKLYEELFERLRRHGYYNAFAGITLPNPASVGFHEAMGFQPVGIYPKIGYKQGEWHDVGWWSLRLRDDESEPAPPKSPD